MEMKIDVIGVPIDLGASRRGVDMGPSAIRYAGLRKQLLDMGLEYRDKGNIPVDIIEYDEENPERKRHIEQINRVNEMLAEQVSNSLQDGCFPVVLGGDHSIAVGTILGVQREMKDIGVIWMPMVISTIRNQVLQATPTVCPWRLAPAGVPGN